MTTSPYASDALPGGTVDTVVTGGGAAGPNSAPVQARTEGLEGLKTPMADLPDTTGRRFAPGMAGATGIPGVRVAGNATGLAAQVGASATAIALAGSHISAPPATADTDAALATAQRQAPTP